ncbi:MAG: hypothetical protein M3511_02325 [Deinococcota bacterium]|jgi:predicted transcriptional regulator|nr:hypothetical protein [Deinococcota bacterium]
MNSNATAEIRLKLPQELDAKLTAQAERERKDRHQLILETLERYLQEEQPLPDFMGAWADSDIFPEDILAHRTPGRKIVL